MSTDKDKIKAEDFSYNCFLSSGSYSKVLLGFLPIIFYIIKISQKEGYRKIIRYESY